MADDNAIQEALNKVKNNGCGEIRWGRTLIISKPIYIDYYHYKALSLHGFGEASKIQVSDDVVDILDSVLTIDYTNDEYGARGLKIDQVYIDCNYRSKHGIVLGGEHPVSQSYFTLVNIIKAINYGLVLDATQNCHFNLVNVEHSYGALRLINGAGNNLFTKCEFNEDIENKDQNYDVPLISFDKDETRKSFGHNGFEDTPQMNIFINPVIERYSGKRQIEFKYGNNNSFIEAEIQYNKITDDGECIYLGENSSYNKISMRINACQDEARGMTNTVIPVNNFGYCNTFYDSYVKNCNTKAVIKANKVTYCRNILINDNTDVLYIYDVNEGHAYNVDNRARYFYHNNDINDLKMGQIGFRDCDTPGVENDLLIKMQHGQIFKILTEKYDDKYANKYKDGVDKYNEIKQQLIEVQKELDDLKNSKDIPS